MFAGKARAYPIEAIFTRVGRVRHYPQTLD